MKSTQAMRDRIRELMGREQDDYDRAVECVIDDLEALLKSGFAQRRSLITDEMVQEACDGNPLWSAIESEPPMTDPMQVKEALIDIGQKAVMRYPYFTEKEALNIAIKIVDAIVAKAIRPDGPDEERTCRQVAGEVIGLTGDIKNMLAAPSPAVLEALNSGPRWARIRNALQSAKEVLRHYAKIDYDDDNQPQPNGAFEVEQMCKEALHEMDEALALRGPEEVETTSRTGRASI